MGEVLQIRVSAVTWNEELVEKKWPELVQLAATIPVNVPKLGVLELVKVLQDGLKFMDWSAKRREALGPGIQKAQALKAKLEEALADWKPDLANRLSDQLEVCLDDLERHCTA